MTIHYSFQVDGKTLTVTTSGFDESLREVQDYGMAIIEVANRHGCERILCDERDLEYRLGTVDTFDAATFIAANAPRVGRIALVCHPPQIADAQFWETVAINRGLVVRVFLERVAAEAWLNL